MWPTRLINVFVAVLLVAGQFAGSVHLASHVSVESALVEGLAEHSLHNHSAFEDATHVHFHVHQAARTASLRDKSPDKPPEKAHSASDCTLCHLASHLLLASCRGSELLQPLVAAKAFVQVAEHPPAQAYTFAHAIRGPPRLSLI